MISVLCIVCIAYLYWFNINLLCLCSVKSQLFEFCLVFVFKWNQSAGGWQSQREVWHECEMTFRNGLCGPGKHPTLCVHLPPLHIPPQETQLSCWAFREQTETVCVSVFVKAFGIPPAGIPEVKVFRDSNMTAPCSTLCLAQCTVNKWFLFYTLPHPSLFINI